MGLRKWGAPSCWLDSLSFARLLVELKAGVDEQNKKQTSPRSRAHTTIMESCNHKESNSPYVHQFCMRRDLIRTSQLQVGTTLRDWSKHVQVGWLQQKVPLTQEWALILFTNSRLFSSHTKMHVRTNTGCARATQSYGEPSRCSKSKGKLSNFQQKFSSLQWLCREAAHI